MTAALEIARATVTQVLGLRRFIGLGLLTVSPGVILYLATGRASVDARITTFVGITTGMFFIVVVPVVTLILSTSVLGDERRDQTLSFIVLRPIRRAPLAIAKIAGAIVATWTITGFGAVILGVAMGIRHDDWRYVLPLIVGAWIACVAYAAIFAPLGYLTERATLIGLAFVFVWETGVASAVGALSSLSAWRTGYSAFVGLAPDDIRPDAMEPLLNVLPGPGGALGKSLVIFAIGTAVTTWILRTRDLA